MLWPTGGCEMSIVVDFFTNKKTWDKLPVDFHKRIPYLVVTTLTMIAFFALSGTMKYLENPGEHGLFAFAVGLCALGFIGSLILMKVGYYEIASYVTIVCLFLNLQWLGFLLPVTSYLEDYRYLAYTFATVIVVNLVSFHSRVLLVYGLACILMQILLCTTVIAAHANGLTKEVTTVMVFGVIILSTITMVSVQISKFTGDLVKIAREGERKSRERFQRLSTLVEDSKKTFNVGETIVESSAINLQRSREVENSARNILSLMEDLSLGTQASTKSMKDILIQTTLMKQGMGESHEAINTTTAGVTEIMATISHISDSAQNKRSGIQSLLTSVENQRSEIEQIRQSIRVAVESSRQFETIIAAISDISEQTSLLAMNASIEAAHAGTSGKGFSVIAGQVKKLSESAKNSSSQVAGILSKNISSMELGAGLIESTSRYFEALTRQVRETVDSIEEVLGGLSEISKGTGEIHRASAQLVALSRKDSDRVETVEHLTQSTENEVYRLLEGSQSTLQAVSGMLQNLSSITQALQELSQSGKSNIQGLNQLEEGLNLISKT